MSAVGGSHVLKLMEGQGAYPVVVREYANALAHGGNVVGPYAIGDQSVAESYQDEPHWFCWRLSSQALYWGRGSILRRPDRGRIQRSCAFARFVCTRSRVGVRARGEATAGIRLG